MYGWLKFFHILAAIIAVGSNVGYVFWLRTVRREPDHEAYVLQRLKVLDSRLANPGYVALPILGIAMVIAGGVRFRDFWVAAAIVLYIVTALVAAVFFVPAEQKLRHLVDTNEARTDLVDRARGRTALTGTITIVIVLVILYFMVLKPGL